MWSWTLCWNDERLDSSDFISVQTSSNHCRLKFVLIGSPWLFVSPFMSRWRWRGHRTMSTLLLRLRQTEPQLLFVPVGQRRAARARTSAACPGCWAQWRASSRPAGRKATQRRESWGWRWRTPSCGGSFNTSPTRWSSPRMDGNHSEPLFVMSSLWLSTYECGEGQVQCGHVGPLRSGRGGCGQGKWSDLCADLEPCEPAGAFRRKPAQVTFSLVSPNVKKCSEHVCHVAACPWKAFRLTPARWLTCKKKHLFGMFQH